MGDHPRSSIAKPWFVFALLLAGLPAAAPAQINYFGQNKVQYRDFDWRVLKGEHVDLYFYPEEDELARVALAYAEESFDVLERQFGHSPRRRIPLIIYASHVHFEQTNILPFVPPEGLLGVTEFLKRRVALPFNGNYAEFRHTLRHELVHAFQLSVLTDTYGRHPRQGRAQIPLWWTEGLAEYWSAGEDSRDEMFLRELTIAGRLPTLPQLTYVYSGIVYPLGGAIHRYLADRFGAWRVQVFYRDLWKYDSFEKAIEGVYGVEFEGLDTELRHDFRRTYYPAVEARRPLDIVGDELAELAIRPVAYTAPEDSTLRYLYLSPSTGYMNIYEKRWERPGEERVVVKGERSAEFESLHPGASRLDVRAGIAAFSSKFQERDALFFWDLTSATAVGRYQFPELVSIRSPAWAPDGRSVVVSALTRSGYSDLYRVWLPDGRLERLTTDRYEDVDPSVSPDGREVVFASDRTHFGPDGALNLYILDLASGRIRPVTNGPWRDETPRWSDDGRIYFASDRDGVFDIFSVRPDGSGRRETYTLSGAFDPQFLPEKRAILFSGFSGFTFNIFRTPAGVSDTLQDTFALAEESDVAAGSSSVREPHGQWSWPELTDSPYAEAQPVPYDRSLQLDFAAGDALVAPGLGTAQGVVFLFSDLLSDHLMLLSATTFQSRDLGGLLENLNAQVFYLNQKQRLNWGVGGFRLRGRFFEGDLSTVFEEESFGGFGVVRWPFSRFERVEGQLRIERSDRFDIANVEAGEERRVGWLASNFVSYVRDNTLWLQTGPIDGQRTNLTAGVANDLTNGRFDAWTLTLDHRRYFRIGQQSAYAVRAFGYYTGGERPRRITIGGPWALRGYPRFGPISGTRAFLYNQELRFPIADFLSIGFPFGELRFPGVQGALFADLGGAWSDASVDRGVLGSAGLGLRMPIGFPIVLRLDIGWRFHLGDVDGYLINPDDSHFVDFFFGFNY